MTSTQTTASHGLATEVISLPFHSQILCSWKS